MELNEKINENTKIVKFLSTGKMYLSRAMSYISIVNFGMILMIALENMKDNGTLNIDINLSYWAPVIFLVTISLAILAGKLEDYFGFARAEKKAGEDRSFHFVKMMKMLERIEERLDRLEGKLK